MPQAHTPPPTAHLRKPQAEDGGAIWDLVRDCKPLDENSMYCNLIQCDHFRDTCVVAERGDDLLGWVSGYVMPSQDDTLFVWQVAVSPEARGLGLGSRMLEHILNRDACADVSRMQTTITRDNQASWALFSRFAKRRFGQMTSEAHFIRDEHFMGQHATEYMVTIDLPQRLQQAA
ncbi:diaminobutyrate acetyltransferase [Pseudodonghicola flavimaris]|uniref:L-2,4-diaminobutyric acid acetyltransferase n=1 Tax=Pseudodonghicola flavimaris TaxID=3050036 RepID=A0ABT7EXK8_9RHOB|nr:diaminobutyrate acetyltransferase [Pseudodonghicola flavimaris]MDK3017079.1 diaminobutyrate acetyltransferase [Pseudodonghicola flavimaris]